MKNHLQALVAAGALALSGVVLADDDMPQHYEGKKAETLEEAVKNLSEYNDKLQKLVSQDDLSAAEMEEVHKLTYTLENALNKINSDLFKLTKTLEDVHLASERRDAETVKEQGRSYLQTSRTVVE
jgi:SMC interacting uncharacterized protein involved in chromosome segregation